MRSLFIVTSSIVTLALASGCSADSFHGLDAKENPTDVSGSEADAATDGATESATDAGTGTDSAVDAALPPTCDAAKLPSDDACVIDEAAGVFVSAQDGTALGDGTRGKPVATITAGIALAKSSNKRVYVCGGTYAEAVALVNGVSLFGGFDCTGWTWNASARAKIVAPTSPALRADSITKDTRVEGFDVTAPAGNASAQSSLGFIAVGSPAVRFVHGSITAAVGFAGAAGADAVQLSNTPWMNGQANVQDAVCTGALKLGCIGEHSARGGGSNTCVGKVGFSGGPGGDGGEGGSFTDNGFQWATVTPSKAGGPALATPQTAAGGNGSSTPQAGNAGVVGSSGANGATMGTFSASGYATSDGTAGSDGAPGQGGGGGAGFGVSISRLNSYATGTLVYGVPGSGGGAGGCPGLAGQSGKGGGASVAVLAFDSPLTFQDAQLTAAAGGEAGAAGASTAGTPGGNGGGQVATPWVAANFLGANGGAGGNAGLPGQGGGGPSVACASHGTAPTLLASTLKFGLGGQGAPAKASSAGTIPASPDGFAGMSTSF